MRVRTFREHCGLSQADLARESGGALTPSVVAKIEMGSNRASTAKIRNGLAIAFGVSLDELNAYLGSHTTVDALSSQKHNRTVRWAMLENYFGATNYHENRWSTATLAAAHCLNITNDATPVRWAEILDCIETALEKSQVSTFLSKGRTEDIPQIEYRSTATSKANERMIPPGARRSS